MWNLLILAWSVNFGVEFWLSLINYTFTIYVIKPAVRQMSGVKSINFDVENIEVIFRLDGILKKLISIISVNVSLSITVSDNDS